ncbi:hypothetical protein A5478_00810 [Legionella pneumophila]|nr:hypothetical protein A5478_00810 [Legionella pneumophila]ANH14604.1 hypothetical protein A5480_00810 [Legionella pneumophila]ANH17570.1 hypothetical protein A5479_00810 [Legionella pneumophila]APX18452.1 hypothetical protein A1D14_00810 [Legionella pneumophila]AQL10631.1 hypothetical protein A1D13_00810 [Legionella pneumophila]
MTPSAASWFSTLVVLASVEHHSISNHPAKCDNFLLNYTIVFLNNTVFTKGDPALYALQEQAKSKGIGLWSEKSPIPPWIFRHN